LDFHAHGPAPLRQSVGRFDMAIRIVSFLEARSSGEFLRHILNDTQGRRESGR
jgi:hypothetical protein